MAVRVISPAFSTGTFYENYETAPDFDFESE